RGGGEAATSGLDGKAKSTACRSVMASWAGRGTAKINNAKARRIQIARSSGSLLLPAKRRFDPRKVVVTVAHRMVLQEKLARERSVAIERHGRGVVQLFVGKRTDRRSRRCTVRFQQGECSFFGDVVILLCVIAVDRIDC